MKPTGIGESSIEALRVAADWLLPMTCVLCGAQVSCKDRRGSRYPLCAACETALRPIAGARCDLCGKPLISESGRCMRCRQAPGRACDTVLPLFRYADEAARVILAWKIAGRKSLGAFWARLAAAEIRARWPGWTVVPVPGRPEKRRQGLFDPVDALSRRLECAGIPVARPLYRSAASAQQKRLSREGRAENARNSYLLRPDARAPARAVILDDVYTTGATIEACAVRLREGGAERVVALVLAAD